MDRERTPEMRADGCCLLYTSLGFGNCPICMAKTQYSLTDDQTKLGAPTGFEVTVRNLKISAGDVYKRQTWYSVMNSSMNSSAREWMKTVPWKIR